MAEECASYGVHDGGYVPVTDPEVVSELEVENAEAEVVEAYAAAEAQAMLAAQFEAEAEAQVIAEAEAMTAEAEVTVEEAEAVEAEAQPIILAQAEAEVEVEPVEEFEHFEGQKGEVWPEREQDRREDLGVVEVGEKKWPGWPGESVFRMLVPAQLVGSVIGRKGEFIKKLVEETRARIKILDGPPGTSERAVLHVKFKATNLSYDSKLEEPKAQNAGISIKHYYVLKLI